LSALKQWNPNVEIHYLTKKQNAGLLEGHPFVDVLHEWNDEVPTELKNQSFDLILDLHNNWRSWQTRWAVKGQVKTFYKANWERFLWIHLGIKRAFPTAVERYLKTIRHLGIQGSFPLSFPHTLEPKHLENVVEWRGTYRVMVLGAAHATKRIPEEKMLLWMNPEERWVLLGGPTEQEQGERFAQRSPSNWINAAGKCNFRESAWILQNAHHVWAGDTGMMHLAGAFPVPLTVVWGSTSGDLGMPAYALGEVTNKVVPNLDCWPCTKRGKDRCPKGHFRCMMEQV
jgi:heptosyltransferase-2